MGLVLRFKLQPPGMGKRSAMAVRYVRDSNLTPFARRMMAEAEAEAKRDYYLLPIVPTIIADSVAAEVYTGSEVSQHNRSGSDVEAVESARQRLSTDERREFADLVEARCKTAYESGAAWMLKIARCKTDAGRNELYMWSRHWLAAYCLHRESFRRQFSIR